ncbi:MAG: hypothetical protein RL365_1536 [Bacteroidota bacterium]|jgi:putative SOS response-associated peptidase YedK
MCYSNSSTSSNEALGKFYQREIDALPSAQPTYYANGFNFPSWNIITLQPQIKRMQWGLIPRWFTGERIINIASKTLNARVETLSEKASFKKLVSTNRCIVPSSGFFEFQHQGKEKIPYFIYPSDAPLFSMAGLYDEWLNRETGETIQSFTIITTVANPLMEEIHNHKKRMPLILEQSQIESYLESEKNINGFASQPFETMQAHRVDKRILFSQTPNIPAVQQQIVDNIGQQSLFI